MINMTCWCKEDAITWATCNQGLPNNMICEGWIFIPCNVTSEKFSHSFDTNNLSGFWLNHQKFLNIGVSASMWLTIQINSNETQHLIKPFPIFSQWLRDRNISAKIAIEELIFVFSYPTNLVASILIIPVVEGYNCSRNIPKANILHFSILAHGLDFFANQQLL